MDYLTHITRLSLSSWEAQFKQIQIVEKIKKPWERTGLVSLKKIGVIRCCFIGLEISPIVFFFVLSFFCVFFVCGFPIQNLVWQWSIIEDGLIFVNKKEV